MDTLIWLGAATSLIGLLGLVWCIWRVWTVRRSGLSDDALRREVQKVVPVNTGALLLSMAGLMLVILGIILTS
ncbi:hypothetical protein K1T73_13375 [Roseovarius sp. SCSIO 43702]|uniref:hypothetical protein n=1 Tax=Roseovarius sp. SCSIO 43702 TaxID=2823043 RepID=UPI001C72DB72|nr:hypothetical protein [Roseovarius sp. SCSIO 43702]QYX56043.1 hypothetical protein K1T73_13375 [Roseovarius sp. SCSIO 43702]